MIPVFGSEKTIGSAEDVGLLLKNGHIPLLFPALHTGSALYFILRSRSDELIGSEINGSKNYFDYVCNLVHEPNFESRVARVEWSVHVYTCIQDARLVLSTRARVLLSRDLRSGGFTRALSKNRHSNLNVTRKQMVLRYI